MTIGLVGRKLGMTRIFSEDGASIPSSVVHVEPNRVTQIKTQLSDGYSALQVTVGSRRASRVTKPMAGHYKKAGVEAGRLLCEFRHEGDSELNSGSELNVEMFSEGQYVDVTGTSKGKGFAGTIKRHHFSGQDSTHGNSLSHRAPGSIGQCQTPGRVFKGKKMAGQMGNTRVTAQNLQVVRVDSARNLLIIKGAIPGSKGGSVIVHHAVKKSVVSA